jgi:hypothetical protein
MRSIVTSLWSAGLWSAGLWSAGLWNAGVLVCLMIATGAAPVRAAPASPEVSSCQIGKPSYCFKYGEGRCPALNKVPNRLAQCKSWTKACLECHTAIPNCIGSRRPLSNAPVCTRCSTSWRTCMNKIDKTYWPKRMKGA